MSDVLLRLSAALRDRYRVERELGQGGMATVYLAHDLRHDRDVAIKVLHPDLGAALGSDRFLTEIRTTARLQHPHILPLLDSGEADTLLYYVMPLVKGETLRARLERERQLPIHESVRIARDVASALDYAHREGVIHRDIKPENILLHDGQVLVADFGIALAVQSAGGARMTQTGLSLGTPHYMSPEQAMGEKAIDARADVYALGAVTYEMLVGTPPFTGASVQAIVAKVLTERPSSPTTVRDTIPAAVEEAVLTALAKLPADRFATAAEFAAALTAGTSGEHTSRRAAPRVVARHGWRQWLVDPRSIAALALLAAAAALAMRIERPKPEHAARAETIRLVVRGAADSTRTDDITTNRDELAAVAPDGRTVAFSVASEFGGALYVRALDDFTLHRIEGGGRAPFFSPDGSSMAFFRGNVVWTMRLADRATDLVAPLPEVMWDLGLSAWHPDGRLLIPGARGVWTVPARGGVAALLIPASTVGSERIERVNVLPDGRLALWIQVVDSVRIDVASADGTGRRVVASGLQAGAVIEDILITKTSGQWRATRIDPQRLTPIGASIAVPDLPAGDALLGRSVAVVGGGAVKRELVWVSRAGVVSSVGVDLGNHRWPRLAPDGMRLAVGRTVTGVTGTDDRIQVIHLRTRAQRSLAGVTEPVWTLDGRRVIASLGGRPFAGLTEQVADGSRSADTLFNSAVKEDAWPTDVSQDGSTIVYYGSAPDSTSRGLSDDPGDISFLDRRTKQRRRLRLPGNQTGGRLSPDGRWLAYQSVVDGRSSVHVRPYPALDADFLISAGHGEIPVWSRDGRELFYRQGRDMMTVPVQPDGDSFGTPVPRVLFTGTFARDPYGDQDYDVSPDGRFLMMQPTALAESNFTVHVIVNWLTDVRARLDRAK